MLALICVILIYIFETPDISPYGKLQSKIGAIIIKFAVQKIFGATKSYFTNWPF